MPVAEIDAPAATKDCLVLTWDTCEMAVAEAEAMRENNPGQSEDDAVNEVLSDQLYWEVAWEDLTEELTSIMQRINPDGLWVAEGREMGWQSRDGSKCFEAVAGKDLLAAVLPKCDYSFRLYLIVDMIAINCAHHDSPVWKEWHYIRKSKGED